MKGELVDCLWQYDIKMQKWNFSSSLLERLGYSDWSEQPVDGLFAFSYKKDIEDQISIYASQISPSSFSRAAMCRRSDGDLAMYVFRGFKDPENNVVEGDIIPIQDHLESLNEIEDAHLRMQLISEGFQTGIWDWNIITGHEWWSDQFYRLLGYEPGEIEPTFQVFMEDLLHPDEKEMIEQAISDHLSHKKKYRREIRLKTKSGQYRWFETSGKAAFKDGVAERMCGAIIDIHQRKTAEIEVAVHEYLLRESGKLVKVGAWEIYLDGMKLIWSQGVYDIHEVDENFTPDVATAINFYLPDDIPVLTDALNQLIEEGIPFDMELQIVTARKNQIWVRAAAEAVRNDEGKIERVRGVFQNIDEVKRKELELKKSMDVITDQNQRLLNFAHIVSHNLRSHTGNLELMLNMLDTTNDLHERETYLDQIKKVSQNLSETIQNLNEIVAIQTSVEKQITRVSLDEIANSTLRIFNNDIERLNADIQIDFSAWNEIDFVKSYMDSIFLNLISNAIKYRSKDRRLQIKIFTETDENIHRLIFSDNGLGIDLERYANKIFGMYKTFHRNKDARGIGLFLTKNQVESMGGSITLNSEIDKGSTFVIEFTE